MLITAIQSVAWIIADSLRHFRNAIEYSRQELKRCQQLLGSKKIDVYTISRVYKDVEEIFREVKVLHDEGLFGAVGASEITAAALEKAHKVS